MNIQEITTLDQLKTHLLERGANNEQVNQQVGKLGDVIVLETLATLLSQRPPSEKLANDDAAAEYIRTNFSSEEISQQLEETATDLVQEYLTAIAS
ncbi:hypothetical protein IT415_01380 [bacterium]|nr:hypothetical protein [bacterium]